MRERLYWVWGRHEKGPGARRALEHVGGFPRGSLAAQWRAHRSDPAANRSPWANLPGHSTERAEYHGAVQRVPRRRPASTIPTSAFGANDLREMVGRIVSLSREHGKAKYVCFEDHGLTGAPHGVPEVVLLFGHDAVTLQTLPKYRSTFARLREAFAPGAEVYLFHCFATADNGRLAVAISQILGVPVYGADAVQDVGDKRMQGVTMRAFNGGVRRNTPFAPEVLHYD